MGKLGKIAKMNKTIEKARDLASYNEVKEYNPFIATIKQERNELCACDSGLKFKDCCMNKDKNFVKRWIKKLKKKGLSDKEIIETFKKGKLEYDQMFQDERKAVKSDKKTGIIKQLNK
jgi:hypothetical protein